MKHVNGKIYLTVYGISALLPWVIMNGLDLCVENQIMSPNNTTVLVTCAVAAIASIAALLAICVALQWKMWTALRCESSDTSGLEAVIFTLIPLVSIIWFYHALYGYAVSYNRFIARHGVRTKGLPETFFLSFVLAVYCRAGLAGTTYFAGPVTALRVVTVAVDIVVYLAGYRVIAAICDAVNALVDSGAIVDFAAKKRALRE